MNKDFILVTSGFIIPNSRLFIELDKETTYRESILNSVNSTGKDVILTELVQAGGIYSSPACNEIYLKYQNDISNFDNYMAMVDALVEVFNKADFKAFVRLQASNTYLSPLGFRLITDLLQYTLEANCRDYNVPGSFFMIPGTSIITTKEISNRQALMDQILKQQPNITAVDAIGSIINIKPALSALFKYMLTDSNRGGSYV